MPPFKPSAKWWIVAGAVLAISVGGCGGMVWLVKREFLRGKSSNNAENLRLYIALEGELRAEIDRLRDYDDGSPTEVETTNRLFELVRNSRYGNNSKEVDTWQKAPHSPERKAIALKWGDFSVGYATYMIEVHRLWAKDFEDGRWPHHVTDDEVKPFKMPEGWTQDDSKY